MSKNTRKAKQIIRQFQKLTKPECEAFDHKANEEQIPLFISALQHKDPQVRGACALVLSKTNNADITRHLIQLLNDKDIWVKICVIKALGNLKDKAEITPILNVLHDIATINNSDTEILYLESIINSLYNIDGEPAITQLIKYMKKNTLATRYYIDLIDALGRICNPELFKLHKYLLSDDQVYNYNKHKYTLIEKLSQNEDPHILELIQCHILNIHRDQLHCSNSERSIINILTESKKKKAGTLLIYLLATIDNSMRPGCGKSPSNTRR